MGAAASGAVTEPVTISRFVIGLRQLLIRRIVRAHGGSFERDAREYAAGAGPAQNFGVHEGIGFGGGFRPTGPAATEASAPRVNLLASSLSTPRRFRTCITRSVAEPPI